METIVLDSESTLVTGTANTNYINHSSTDFAIIDNDNTVFITLSSVETILVETDTSQVVVTGQLGPAGKDGIAEENIVYSKRTDFIDDSTLYKGEAVPGSTESAQVWRIRKINMFSDGDITETWAAGSAEFNKAWSDRSSYTYI